VGTGGTLNISLSRCCNAEPAEQESWEASRILGFVRSPDERPRSIDAVWKDSDREVDFYRCAAALESLRDTDIMIPSTQAERIVSLVIELLEQIE
jgi:hypothetical protein